MEHFQASFGGMISIMAAILKVDNTVFAHNLGYDIFYYPTQVHFLNRLDTYRCLFEHGNLSFKSNMNFFEQAAARENIIGNVTTLSKIDRAFQETPYASSKSFTYLQ